VRGASRRIRSAVQLARTSSVFRALALHSEQRFDARALLRGVFANAPMDGHRIGTPV
jgi:hypothetical protein